MKPITYCLRWEHVVAAHVIVSVECEQRIDGFTWRCCEHLGGSPMYNQGGDAETIRMTLAQWNLPGVLDWWAKVVCSAKSILMTIEAEAE